MLGEIGDSAVKVDKTGITGLVVAKTAFNPFEVIEKLRKILMERPYEFRYTLRVIPIEKIVRTDLGEMERAVTELTSKIEENESFRVTVEKRFTDMTTQEIVEVVAASIERRVDLSNPDKIILVEVVGRLTGISIISPEQILAVMREKFQS